MGTAAIVCNALLFAMTGIIILTEGVPRDAGYLVLTLLMLLVPLLTGAVLVRERTAPRGRCTDDDGGSSITLPSRAAVPCSLVLFGASCWAVVSQYPYPEGNSVIPLAVLAVGTPILSLVALLRGGGESDAEGEAAGRR